MNQFYYINSQLPNETVSVGDTAVSLHTPVGGGWYSRVIKTKSPNPCSNFHWGGILE